MKRLAFMLMLCAGAACAQEGVNVGEASSLRTMVPAEQMEQQAAASYRQLLKQAAAKDALAPDSHPELKRLRAIANRLLPHAVRFNPRAAQWQWEVNLIGARQINAFCMPGGKIAFYTGILNTLKLTDDEVAMIMGHEMAHALREHAREQAAKNTLTGLAANVLGMVFSGSNYSDVANIAINAGHGLAARAFSRSDEREADLVGMELAARGGFDPQAGITLWEKMGNTSKGAPPEFLSTHPANASRIEDIRRHLPDVMPLYLRAKP
ncbi:MAG: M48 family metallopeptidase [Rhodocyclaceae bacterium]|jgi:predicted Zn-dependent protease|nr:M48 family metallopeptidase [Rhodocyclaceae bacterium]